MTCRRQAGRKEGQGEGESEEVSLLWTTFPPGTIARVARAIKHCWSLTNVCALHETSSTGQPRNLDSERQEYPRISKDIQGYTMYIRQMICQEYTRHIPGIYIVYIPCISLDIHGISIAMYIHGISLDIPCIYHPYGWHFHMDGIYQVYTRHIPKIGVPDDS